jgi:transcriptional regulator with XRE-family HTH domain
MAIDLKAHRSRAGLTQAELAHRSGISLRQVKAIESGEASRPHPHTTRSLLCVLQDQQAEVLRRSLMASLRDLLVAFDEAAIPSPGPRSGTWLTGRLLAVRDCLAPLLLLRGLSAARTDPLVLVTERAVNTLAGRCWDFSGSMNAASPDIDLLRRLL